MKLTWREKIQLALSAVGLFAGATMFVVSSNSFVIMVASVLLGAVSLIGLAAPLAKRLEADLFPDPM